MARRRSYYGTKRRTTPRRVLLYTTVIVVVGLAGYQLYQQRFADKTTGGDLDIITPDDNTSLVHSQPAKKPLPDVVKNESPVTNSTHNAATPDAAADSQASEQSKTAVVIEPEENNYHPQFSEAMLKYNAGIKAADAGKVIEARNLLSESVASGLPWETEKLARTRLNDLARLWLFTKNIYDNDPHCLRYKVQSGDYLSTIGQKFGVPYQFLMRINGISRATNLRADENIKVIKGPFMAVADRTKFILTLYLDDVIAFTWQISTGREGRSTPTGKWMVTKGKKLLNPEWTDPDTGKTFLPDDPDNPLGERWIGIHGIEGAALGRTGFGIHGTIEPKKIGQPASRGCIRLRNQDVELVYDMLAEGQSVVTIKD